MLKTLLLLGFVYLRWRITGRKIVSASGSSAEIGMILASTGEPVLTQLLAFLNNSITV
jgi:hypothetical protein